MSSVAVNTMLMMSSCSMALRSSSSANSSWTRFSISSEVSASIVVAPRSARTAGGTTVNLPSDLGSLGGFAGRNGETDHGTGAAVALRPDPTAVALDHLLADGQADACARARVRAAASVEHAEHGGRVSLRQPSAVVAHGEQPLVALPVSLDDDLQRAGIVSILHRVADEVLEEPCQL